MQAAVLTDNGFELQNVALPTMGDDEVLVKTIACGVCSGDLFVYQNRAKYVETYNRLGHEGSGEVVANGSQVTNFKPGDIVTALSMPAYAEFYMASPAELV